MFKETGSIVVFVVCSVVINVICIKGFDLFNIDAISRNPPSTPNLNKCFTKLIDDDG